MHDIGDLLGTFNHAELGAAIMKPFISEANFWMMENHAIFQGYYFFHHIGLDRDLREQFRGHEHFEYTAQFCHLYDQAAFDPNYESMSLEDFEPMVRRVMERGSLPCDGNMVKHQRRKQTEAEVSHVCAFDADQPAD